jgi:hypothetical protein
VVVKIAAADRFDVYLSGTLAASAGNFPVSNAVLTFGPIALVGNKGTAALRLVDQNGVPAPNIKVTARAVSAFLDLTAGGVSQRGAIDAQGTSGSDGVVTIPGLPDYAAIGPLLDDTVSINIPPQKAGAGIETYSFLGLTTSVNPSRYSSGLGQVPTIVLAGPRSPLTVLSSNVDWFETNQAQSTYAFLNPIGPITIAFNQAVAQSSVRTVLLTESGALAQVNLSTSVNGNLVTIGFARALDPGRYSIAFAASAAYADQPRSFTTIAPFFIGQMMGATVTVSPTSRMDPNNPAEYILVFSEPIGVGNGSATAIPCVTFYEADLDGDPQTTSPGEWNSGGNHTLKCETNQSHPGLYLRPDEPQVGVSTSLPTTGFTTQWRLRVKDVCFKNYQCSTSGRAVHLVFSRNNDPNFVLRRVNGAPVPDLPVFTLPAF